MTPVSNGGKRLCVVYTGVFNRPQVLTWYTVRIVLRPCLLVWDTGQYEGNRPKMVECDL